MKLTVKYVSNRTEIFIDTEEKINDLIRELRQDKSIYYWYILETLDK